MANTTLTVLLKEYEQRKLFCEREFSKKINSLYENNPRLQEIDAEINRLGFSIIRSKLSSTSEENTNSFLELQDKLKNEKQSILTNLNIDTNNLKPSYFCNMCEDTGFVTDTHLHKSMCSCLKQRLLNAAFDNSNLASIRTQNFNTFDENIFSDIIENNSTHQLSPRQNVLQIKDAAQKFIDNFSHPNCPNLLFTGNTGLGKTFLSNCIAYELLSKGKTVLYQTAPILLENIIRYKINLTKNKSVSNSPEDSNTYYATLNSDLLIIDDLGTESINTMKLTELFNIINARILNKKKTIISTNLNIHQIFTNYEERIGSRIAGYYNSYNFYGDDIRLRKYKK